MTDDPVMLWLGLALAVFGLVYALRRTPGVCKLWAAIPDDLKPFAPVAFGVTMAGIEAIASGRSVRQALAIAASAALTAMLAHHGLRFAPGPYGAIPLDESDTDRHRIPPPSDPPSPLPPTGGPPQAA